MYDELLPDHHDSLMQRIERDLLDSYDEPDSYRAAFRNGRIDLFSETRLNSAFLSGLSFARTVLNNLDFSDSDLSDADFRKAELIDCSLAHARARRRPCHAPVSCGGHPAFGGDRGQVSVAIPAGASLALDRATRHRV